MLLLSFVCLFVCFFVVVVFLFFFFWGGGEGDDSSAASCQLNVSFVLTLPLVWARLTSLYCFSGFGAPCVCERVPQRPTQQAVQIYGKQGGVSSLSIYPVLIRVPMESNPRLLLPSSKSTFCQPSKEKCMNEVVRIGSTFAWWRLAACSRNVAVTTTTPFVRQTDKCILYPFHEYEYLSPH